MKNTITLVLLSVFFSSASAQILNRVEVWPDPQWTLGGTYSSAALVFNPTTSDNKFKYVASLAVPSGSGTTIFIASPVFSLKAAFDGGQKAFKMDLNIAYQTFVDNVISFQYWNADTSAWVIPADGSGPADTLGDFAACTNPLVDLSLDFSGFTINQLQNFRYRFAINDTGGQISGVCINPPVIKSFSCLPPTNLIVSNIGTSNATLDWTGSGTNYEIEYGLQGFTLGTGFFQQSNSHPIGVNGLASGVDYEFYVRDNCSNSPAVKSTWSGPKSFKTLSLGLEEHKLKGFKLYPNPFKNTLWMESEKALNEIRIFNLTGQELMKEIPNKSNTSIDLSSLSAGFYFLKVVTDTDFGTYKILKE